MATHSSILAWRIPGTEEPVGYRLWGHTELDGVITDLEPDILECEVKWALESITTNKTSGGDGIPVELFQILKDDAVKVLPSIFPSISVFYNESVLCIRRPKYRSFRFSTAEFSKFADILSAALSQHHLSGFGIAQLEFHHLH